MLGRHGVKPKRRWQSIRLGTVVLLSLFPSGKEWALPGKKRHGSPAFEWSHSQEKAPRHKAPNRATHLAGWCGHWVSVRPSPRITPHFSHRDAGLHHPFPPGPRTTRTEMVPPCPSIHPSTRADPGEISPRGTHTHTHTPPAVGTGRRLPPATHPPPPHATRVPPEGRARYSPP